MTALHVETDKDFSRRMEAIENKNNNVKLLDSEYKELPPQYKKEFLVGEKKCIDDKQKILPTFNTRMCVREHMKKRGLYGPFNVEEITTLTGGKTENYINNLRMKKFRRQPKNKNVKNARQTSRRLPVNQPTKTNTETNKKKKGRETMKKVNSKKFTSNSTFNTNTLQSETVIEEFDSVKAIFERVLKELPAYQAKLNKDEDKDKKCVAVFDLDETVLKNTDAGTRTFPNIRNFINTLRRRGVTIVFITARRESSRQETIKTLTKLKLVGQLVMRPDDAGKSSNVKAAQRKQIAEKAGCSLFLNVGDQLSDISPSTEWHLVSKTFSTLPEGSAVGRAVRSADPTHDHHHRLKHAFNILDTPFLVWGGLGGDMIKHTHMSVKMPNLGTFTK